MNPAGVVLIVAGLWIGAQVFSGNALKRLGIVSDSDAGKPKTVAPGPTVPHGIGGI